MKKVAIVFLLVGMIGISLGCIALGNGTQATPTSTQFMVLPLDVNGELITNSPLRSGPGANFDEIATLPQGTAVHIIGTSYDLKWYLTAYINSKGLTTQGWILAEDLSLISQTSSQSTSTQTVTTNMSPTPAPTNSLMNASTPTITSTSKPHPNPTQTHKKKTPRSTLMPLPQPTASSTGTPQRFSNP